MKRITLIASTAIITFTLVAFSYSNWSGQPTKRLCSPTAQEIEPPTFAYDLSLRGKNTITKERMHTAKTIADLIPDHSTQENLKNNILSVRDNKIRIEDKNLHQSKHEFEKGNGNSLNQEQLLLLKSTDYSTNFALEGYTIDNDVKNDNKEEHYFNYYMTVVPEQQATYKGGNLAFINFLKTNCQPTIANLQKGNLKSGKISFMVTKTGTISDINIDSTCGYPSVDERMLELINKHTDLWNVATNGKGEKVDQVFVFSYGQRGC